MRSMDDERRVKLQPDVERAIPIIEAAYVDDDGESVIRATDAALAAVPMPLSIDPESREADRLAGLHVALDLVVVIKGTLEVMAEDRGVPVSEVLPLAIRGIRAAGRNVKLDDQTLIDLEKWLDDRRDMD